MIPVYKKLAINELANTIRADLEIEGNRVGLVTSIDGNQLITLMLNTRSGNTVLYQAELASDSYTSLTTTIPQLHWHERAIHDLFGLIPLGHPRLKPAIINESCETIFAPLRETAKPISDKLLATRDFEYLHISGEPIFELPVGPVHAGIIEPGHFMLSCLGEDVLNLEVRLGYLHRGIEKRITEIPWRKARFVAEAAASDTACANALAHALAIESLLAVEPSFRSQGLRTLALEIERLAMHIGDIAGMAYDLGYLVIAANFSRLRGTALRLAELLSGSRFLRGYICPGGVVHDPDRLLSEIQRTTKNLRENLKPALDFFISNPAVYERLRNTGKLSSSLASEFGMVGVVARACNIAYDCRQSFAQGSYPKNHPTIALQQEGDALARTLVRIAEINSSLDLIDTILSDLPSGTIGSNLPVDLPANAIGIGIVEAFRGELIHLVITDKAGSIKRYAIKDPSFNNWTGLAIAMRNNVIADFPICNKSFALSYSGHDL
jgi:Ni,Fe-hydrogenase III large subunit